MLQFFYISCSPSNNTIYGLINRRTNSNILIDKCKCKSKRNMLSEAEYDVILSLCPEVSVLNDLISMTSGIILE